MKKYIFLLLGLTLFAAACKDRTQYSINGRISNADGKYIYLDELNVTSTVSVDSVRLNKKGEFEFRGKVTYPTFFLLKLDEKNFVTLLVDSAEHVEVYGDAANFSRDYLVKGSEGSSLVQQLNIHLSKTKHELDSIRSLEVSFRNDLNYDMKKQLWDKEYEKVRQAQIGYSKILFPWQTCWHCTRNLTTILM